MKQLLNAITCNDTKKLVKPTIWNVLANLAKEYFIKQKSETFFNLLLIIFLLKRQVFIGLLYKSIYENGIKIDQSNLLAFELWRTGYYEVCTACVETINELLLQEIRYLDKLIDELVKGKAMIQHCGVKNRTCAVRKTCKIARYNW